MPELVCGTTRLNLASQSEPFGLLCSMSLPVAFVSVEFVLGVVGIGEYLIFAPVAGFVPAGTHVGVAAVLVLVLVLLGSFGVVEGVLLDVSVDGVVPDAPSMVPDALVGQLVFGVAVVGVAGVVGVVVVLPDGVVCAPAGAARTPMRANAAARLKSRFMPVAP